MLIQISNYISKYGIWAMIRLPFYPITLLFWGPIRFFLTLWNARVFMEGKWSKYISFGVSPSINQLFYRTQIINIDRHGRNGVSPHLSLGNYHLGYWWHLSLPASYLYWAMGAVLPLTCLFGWLGMHLFWLIDPNIDPRWCILVLLLALTSSTFFANLFVVQNYNAIGWLFFPLGLWAMINGYYFVCIIVWLVASFGSITVVLIAGIISLIYAFSEADIWILLTILPAGVKILTHFYWSISKQNISENSPGIRKSLTRTIKAIGISSIGVKYRRPTTKSISKTFLYFTTLYLQFGLCLYFVSGSIPLIWGGGILIFFINSLVARFSDPQSMYMMMFSFATLITLRIDEPLLLCSYWLVVTPLPSIIYDSVKGSAADMPAPLSPFNIQVLVNKVDEFFESVTSENRVLFAFDNPNDRYENIFDGYRSLLELPLYVASVRKFLLFPSWWAVFENNYNGAQEFWGRGFDEVSLNVQNYNADFVIVYQNNGADLDQKFLQNGYKLTAKIDWADFSNYLRNEDIWETDKAPKWWLLKVPD